MKNSKLLDFNRKLAIIREMAEYFGWVYIGINPDVGQMHFIKDRTHLNVWSTKMTFTLTKDKRVKSFKNQTIQQIEKVLEFIPNI